MPTRTMDETLDGFGDLLDDFDKIARRAHARYRAYRPEDLIELDARAQAACIYAHMMFEADRLVSGRDKVRSFDLRGLKLWLFEDLNAVIRFKKMDEDGKSRNYPTKQAKDFDAGIELPGLPMPPVRLTVGYLLDVTGTAVQRAQIARPVGRGTQWCAAIVPAEARRPDVRAWIDVTRQGRL
jgi:hypothetical protein